MNNLQTILEKLAEKIPVDRIYAFEYPFLGEKKQRLLIVIDSKVMISVKTLEPMAELCLAEIPQYSFELIPYGELKTAITNGSLYYVIACQEEHLRLATGKKALPYPTSHELENMKVSTKEHYEKASLKQKDFLDGTAFYCGKKNFPQALFMFHQATELTLRGIENAIFKRDRPSHSLQEHFKLLVKYIPEFASQLSKEDPACFHLLKLIDQSYTAVRYQRNFEVGPEEMEQMEHLIFPILNWCNDYYDYCMEELYRLIAQARTTSRKSEQKTPVVGTGKAKIKLQDKLLTQLNEGQLQQLKTILGNLLASLPIKALYLLGSEIVRNEQESLYKISTETSPIAHFHLLAIYTQGHQTKSHTITHPLVKATVLTITESNVMDCLKKKNRFIIQTLSEGTLLYAEGPESTSFQIPEQDWALVLQKTYTVWAHRYGLAQDFYEAALWSNRDVDSRHAALLLLGQSLEQVCAGLLYVCSGYRTDNYTLTFLLETCRLIAPELTDSFAPHTELDKRLLQWLSNCLTFLRYKKEEIPNYEELDYLMQRVKVFINLADKRCQTEFGRLEQKLTEQELTGSAMVNE